jgi:mono/diheme cytochrome c family protein
VSKFVLGLVLGVLIVPAVAWGYFRFGRLPVAVADTPFLLERQLVRAPLHTRIDDEMPASAPISATPENLLDGAVVYREQCAACHGLPERDSSFATHMYPQAPQLWRSHHGGVIGVNDDPAGETYWKVSNGIRLTGMPAFDKTLTTTEMWQVSLLLKSAGTTLPPPVIQLLGQPIKYNPPMKSDAQK